VLQERSLGTDDIESGRSKRGVIITMEGKIKVRPRGQSEGDPKKATRVTITKKNHQNEKQKLRRPRKTSGRKKGVWDLVAPRLKNGRRGKPRVIKIGAHRNRTNRSGKHFSQ